MGKFSEDRIEIVNESLREMCQFTYDVKFLDLHSKFCGRRDLFARDGLHLSNAGVTLFGNLVNVSVGTQGLN